jgi:hypothetical protein
MMRRSVFSDNLRRARLSLECLESRETPAGVVTLSLLNNALTFTGDGNVAGNQVKVSTFLNNSGRFLIEGQNGTTFFIAGKGNVGGTVDTGSLPAGVPAFTFPDNGTTAIKATFTGGPDRFEYDGTLSNPAPPPNLPFPIGFGDITLNMGAGDDTVVIRQILAKNVTINSTAPTGVNTDNDTIHLLAGGSFDFDNNTTPEDYLGGFRGSVTINGQSGNDAVTIAASVGGNVAGTFNSAGDSFRVLGGSRIGGTVTVADTATTKLALTTFEISGDSKIGKSVTLNNSTNAAAVNVANSTIGGSLTLNSGSGLTGSTFNLNNVSVTGALAITGGTLTDTVSIANINVGTNVTMNMGNGGNAGGDGINTALIGGNLTVTYGTGNDTFNLQNAVIAGATTVTAGEGVDRFNATNVSIGKTLTTNMGNGGNGAGDSFNNVGVAGIASMTYGSGDDILNILGSTFSTAATITNGAGLDRLSLQNSAIGGAFAYTGGAGGNGGVGNPDVISGVRVGGTFKITYGANDDHLNFNNSTVVGAATISGGNGNDVFGLTSLTFLGALSVTGGLGTDTINVADVSVFGTTALTTSGGDDFVNITQRGRFKGKVSINTGGAGNDLDTITIQADAGNETTFLGGLSIITGPSPANPPLDTTTVGTAAGRVVVMNGFSYPDAEAALDNLIVGNNLLII